MHQHSLPLQQLPVVDENWTLLLDRDGVINKEEIGGYVLSAADFSFEEGALEALKTLSILFTRIIVVSNQRGVGKGLMTEQSLDEITAHMLDQVQEAGGRIDAIYYCTSVDPADPLRKPNNGMAHLAKTKFPEIDFMKSIMVGNMPSDMWFGRNIGAYTVYLPNRDDEQADDATVDARYKDLLGFAEAITAANQKQ